MSHTSLRVNPHSIVCMNVKELLGWSRRHIWSLSDRNVIPTHNHLVPKRTLNHLAKLPKWLSCVVISYLYGAFVCMLLSCHIQSYRVNPHSIVCLNVNELLAWSRRHIWSLSDSNVIRTHNHLMYAWGIEWILLFFLVFSNIISFLGFLFCWNVKKLKITGNFFFGRGRACIFYFFWAWS